MHSDTGSNNIPHHNDNDLHPSLGGFHKMPPLAEIKEILTNSRPTHPNDVVHALQNRYPARIWQLVKTKEIWRSDALVLSADGKLIAADADAWMKQEAATSSARDLLAATIKREGIVLARSEELVVYAIGVEPADPLDFGQVRFCVKTQLLCSLQHIEPWALGGRSDSYMFPWDNAKRSAPCLVTSAKDIVHSLDWLERCKTAHKIKRQQELWRLKRRVVRCHLPSGRLGPPIPLLEHDRELSEPLRRPSREERWFSDWRHSSAGELPMGRHWYLDTHDHTDKEGVRHVGFIPRAVIWPGNKVEAGRKSPFRLMEELTRLDQRIKCPSGWYFHMVYGNRVSHVVGEVIAEGIRRGGICLPVRDEAILMAWIADPYRF